MSSEFRDHNRGKVINFSVMNKRKLAYGSQFTLSTLLIKLNLNLFLLCWKFREVRIAVKKTTERFVDVCSSRMPLFMRIDHGVP